MKVGRPKGSGKSKLDTFRPEIEGLLANGFTKKSIAQRYNTTGPNLYNWMKRHGLKNTKARKPSYKAMRFLCPLFDLALHSRISFVIKIIVASAYK
jgi:hypothetical protein